MLIAERVPPRHTLGIALALLFSFVPLAAGPPAAASPVNAHDVAEADGAADAADAANLAGENGGVSEGSYGYFRVVEGGATLVQAGNGNRSAAAVNQPVMPGDRILVADRGRVEIVLSDRNLLRLDGGSEVVLLKLAGTPDTNDRATQIRLEEGNFQLVVVQDSLGDTLPRVDTPNATVYVQYPGSYRITSDQGSWSSVVVRRGTAEVVTDRGSVRVRADGEAHVEGERNARTDVAQAGAYDAVERWGRSLETQVADNRYLDERLSYEGAPLSRYGSWIEINNQHYWRPTVDGGWRPFTDGYWTPTPSGLTWVATEPWGWVPYHYGSWDYVDGYGWVWAPGYVYSPAWVYWYWGPSQIGWCPVGYYTRWYGHRYHDPAFRHGVYGWAGGDWDLFGNWTFVSVHHFGHRDLGRWAYRGSDIGRHGEQRGGHGNHGDRGGASGDVRGDMRAVELPRGIITTDTRPLKPTTWKNPEEVLRAARNGNGRNAELPDVTSFIARKPQLPDTVLRTVRNDGTANLDGTPLKPSTLGRDRRAVAGVNGSQAGAKPDTSWNDREPGKPRIVFGDGGPGGASPSRPNPTKPEVRSGGSTSGADSSTSGRPRIVIEKPARPESGDSNRGSEPTVRERPSRPAPEADGGAPRPRRVEIDTKPGRVDSGDRGDRSSTESRPEVRERRPPVDREQIQRQIEVERQRQQADRERESSETRQRSERPREDVYVRPDRDSRPDPYVRESRPEPRVEPRREEPSPQYDRGRQESRPEPRVEPRSEPERSRGSETRDNGNRGDRGSRSSDSGDRGNRGNDRPQVRERRPPAP